MHHWQAELKAALAAADKAGQAILRLYAAFEAMDTAPADISTQADKESQECIAQFLLQNYPGDGICAEEDTVTANDAAINSNRYWVIDPIDGTRGFAIKNGEFSVMIALVVDGVARLGVVAEPLVERVTYAAENYGCFTQRGGNPQRCAATTTAKLDRCVASISRSQSADAEKRFRTTIGLARTTPTFSAGIKLAQVARGETDLYLGDYLGLADWDVCAGHLLVEQAGGRVSNIDGKPISYDGSGRSLRNRGILASNGQCHDAFLQAMQATGYRPR